MGSLHVDPTAAPAIGIGPGGAEFDGVTESFAVEAPAPQTSSASPGEGTETSIVVT